MFGDMSLYAVFQLKEIVSAFGILKAYRLEVNVDHNEPCAFLEVWDLFFFCSIIVYHNFFVVRLIPCSFEESRKLDQIINGIGFFFFPV